MYLNLDLHQSMCQSIFCSLQSSPLLEDFSLELDRTAPLSPFLDKTLPLSLNSRYVMLSPDRDEHRPCKVKGSSYMKTQVDVEVF